MNKKEWKLQHAANRRIHRGLFYAMTYGERHPTMSPNFNIASKMFWNIIIKQHSSFYYALTPNITCVRPIKCKWSIRSNTYAFNHIRRENSIDKINRKLV